MSCLKVNNLSGGYGKKNIFSNLTLPDIAPGSMVSILGANGAGKSTFLKTVAGILKHSNGTVSLGDQQLFSLPVQKRSQLTGYMEQDHSSDTSLLAYESIVATLQLHSSVSKEELFTKVDGVFSHLQITELAMKPMNQMSGGERQMISFAHILARSPKLMLLDEPTSALDLKKQTALISHVRDFVKEKNAIAMTIVHDLNMAMRYSDVIMVLGTGGTLLGFGAPEEVMSPDLLEKTYNVRGRIEKCSSGYMQVIIDAAL